MTHDELITVARTHTIEDLPKLSGEQWATSEMLPKVSVTDAVVVSSESDQRPEKMFVVLERESGKVVASGLHFQKKCPGSLMRAEYWPSGAGTIS